MFKMAVITGFMGQLRDRFCFYNDAHPIEKKLELIADIPGIEGTEIVYPQDFEDTEKVIETVRRLGLGISAVNVNVKSDPEFADNSLTSRDPQIRRKAVGYIKNGMDLAHRLGVGRITCCPLSDGHDYPFQSDYKEEWHLLKESVAEAAAHRPDIIVSLEYKPSETRVRCTLGGVYSSILLAKEIGLPNVGVTMDVGHSLYNGENPAQSLAMLYYHGVRPYLHVNDNYRNWDWDLMPGAINYWDLIEFLWVAIQNGYNDWITFDVFPARMNPTACFESSAKMLKSMIKVAQSLEHKEINRLRQLTDGRSVPELTEYVWKKAGIRLDEGV